MNNVTSVEEEKEVDLAVLKKTQYAMAAFAIFGGMIFEWLTGGSAYWFTISSIAVSTYTGFKDIK